jgi:CBS domain-containing protein
MNVSSILRSKGTHVETARPQTTAAEAAERLTSKGVGSLVVLDGRGILLGVLAERDIVRAVAEHTLACGSVPVVDLLKKPPATCRAEDSLRDVMSVMTRRRARHLPVLAGEALVGIISIGDVVKGLLEELELEVGVLRDYARARR